MILNSNPFNHPECNKEHLCPWGVHPSVGMWARVRDENDAYIELWGTDCVCYKVCPRRHYTKKQWKDNYERKHK